MHKMIFAAVCALALTAPSAWAGTPYNFFVYVGAPNVPIVFGSEPVALKICNGNSFLVKLLVDGTEVHPRATQCVIVVGKDIQATRYPGSPPTTSDAAFTITIEILGVKETHL